MVRFNDFIYNETRKASVFDFDNGKRFKKISGVSSASIAKRGKGANITTDVLLRICEALDCDITDIMDIVKTKETIVNTKE